MLKLKLFVLLGLLLLFLTACGQPPAAVTKEPAARQPESGSAGADTIAEPPKRTQEIDLAEPESVDACTDCHTDPVQLKAAAGSVESERDGVDSEPWASEGELLEPLEPWEKVLVDPGFPQSNHGLKGCTSCHGGVQSADKDAAHEGIVSNPSMDPQAACGECHPNVVLHSENSLHANLTGFWTALEARSQPQNHPKLEEGFAQNCSSCHTTCGDCHVSRPGTAGGGFVSGHLFNRTPSMTENCTACHGSRAGDEFMGQHQGLAADVHFAQGEMQCVDCHSGEELHGGAPECISCHEGPVDDQVPPAGHRYGGIQSPRCETCHPNVANASDGIIMHEMHGSKLSCQVCHSISYRNCDGCHVGGDEDTAEASFELDSSYHDFLIGRNPIQTYDRPYEYVPVRHAPVSPDSFEFYGENLLPLFDRLETWKYATPHNIQRSTPQTESCNTCHGNPDWFLTADKVSPDELEANSQVIVEEAPERITSGSQLPPQR